MPHLLYMQNSKNSTDVDPVLERIVASGMEVTQFDAYRGAFPDDLAGYDAMYLTGSPHGAYDDVPWIHREHEVLQQAAASRLPMLGVCFGSQILGSALCGRDQVFRRSACEVGYVDLAVRNDRDDPLLAGIGDELRMFVWHNDEVRAEHADMTILASSLDCPNHIWRFRDLPIWGIQGHPEVTTSTATEWLDSHRRILERDGADVDALIHGPSADPAVELLLANFLASVRRGG